MNIATKSTDAHTKNYHMVQIIIVVVPGAPGRLPQIVSFVEPDSSPGPLPPLPELPPHPGEFPRRRRQFARGSPTLARASPAPFRVAPRPQAVSPCFPHALLFLRWTNGASPSLLHTHTLSFSFSLSLSPSPALSRNISLMIDKRDI